jgi:hypothetical protein
MLEVGTVQDGKTVMEPTLKWVMHVWNPSEGSLRLFTWFSPAQLLMMYLSGNPNCRILIVCGYLTALMVFLVNQIHFLVDAFQQHVIDYNILAGQLLLDSKGMHQPIQWAVSPQKQTTSEE